MKKLRLIILLFWGTFDSIFVYSQSYRSDMLFAEGVSLYKLGKYKQAIPFFAESDSLDKEEMREQGGRRLYSSMWLASCLYKLGNVESAKEISEYFDVEPVDRRFTVLSDSIGALGTESYNKGNFREALSYFIRCAEMEKSVLGSEHIYYGETLLNCAWICYDLGKYDSADKFLCEYETIVYLNYGENSNIYLNELSSLYDNIKKNKNTNALSHIVEKIKKATNKEAAQNMDYVAYLAYISNDLNNYWKVEDTSPIEMQILKLINEIPNARSHNLFEGLACHCSNWLYKSGYYVKAIELRKEALSVQEIKYGKDDKRCAISLYYLSNYYKDSGNIEEALSTGKEAFNIIERNYKENDTLYAAVLENMSSLYLMCGNYKSAEEAGERVLLLKEKIYEKRNIEYVISLNNLATCKMAAKKYDEAVNLFVQAGDLIDKDSPEYGRILGIWLSNYAECCLCLGLYDVHDNLSEIALNVKKKAYCETHPSYADELLNKASVNMKRGKYKEALSFGEKAAGIYAGYKLGYMHAMSMKLLSICQLYLGNIDNVAHLSYLSTKVLTDYTLNAFSEMSQVERYSFWERCNDWFSFYTNFYAFCFPTDTLCMTAYNCALLSKGLLLNSEIEMRKLLQESGDAVVDSLYEEMRINKLMLQRLYEKPKNERFLNTDSIEKIVDGLEKQLLKRSKVYGDYTKNLRIDYKDVRGKLKDGDLAVEFCSFPLSKDSTMYMALVLRNDMEYPKMIPLFEEKQISKTSSLLEEMQIGTLRRDIYMGGHTATLVWKPLEQYLNNAKNVYFSPSGELYNIAIENIPHWSEECLMSDKWNIYRLSSTRELAVIRDKDVVRKASVYGGIMYDTGTDMLTADTVRYGRQRSVFYGLYNLSDSLSVRGGVEYLPATKEEAEYVDDVLKGRHIASTLRTDMQATEGAFKDMAGKRNNLLHIATHAFYWPEKEVATADRDFMFISNMPQRYKEDKAMTRSGLVLAGANNALRGMKLPEDVNDGILTAKEIAQLDLRGLDLVVLSACQTGLGEVTGDGVFGLQRGFKKAGANSLMLSLWSVDDEATSLFMKEFYRQLMAGNGKHESMKAAQRHVREYKETDEDGEMIHPYDNYKYWAAFVLLDAIR